MNKHLFQWGVALCVVFAGTLTVMSDASAATVQADRLPPPQIVRENSAQLKNMADCEHSAYVANQAVIDVPAGKPYRVLAPDQPDATIFYCSTSAVGTLTLQAPNVAGTSNVAQAAASAENSPVLEATHSSVKNMATALPYIGRVFGPVNGLTWGQAGSAVVSGSLKTIGELAELLADVGGWLLEFAFTLLTFSLTASSFLTNPLVRQAWPFVQGIANLGFMLALIFIALATTLQLEIGGGVRRLLPRLFIAALLLNFSLVIAGVLIDVTRVIMAILLNALTPAGLSMDTLADGLLDNSGLIQAFRSVKNLAPAKFDFAVTAIVKMILIWTFALSVLSIAVGLLVRYIMLILLLILSPAAYLAFALPGAQQLGERWWKEFFKYLFYGPIALFFLIIALSLNKLNLQAAGGGDAGLQSTLNVVLMVALMIAAATASKKMGGSFSVAILNYAQGKATGIGKKAGQVGLGVATYIPRKTGEAVSKRVSDATGDLAKDLRRSDFGKSLAGRLLLGPERDKDGNIKKGQKSAGTKFAGAVKQAAPYFLQDKDANQRAADAVSASSASPLGISANLGDRALSASRLRKSNVLKALMKAKDTNITDLLSSSGNVAQINAVITNKDFLRDLTDKQKLDLEVAIQGNVTGVDRGKIMDKYLRTLDDIDDGK